MVRIAGKPILGHILTQLVETEIEEVVLVVGGPMKDQIREYVMAHYTDEFDVSFVNQENAQGLGHAVYQARDVVEGDTALIALGDMLFNNGYGTFLEAHRDLPSVDGSIGVKEVEEPEHYGVVDVGEDGFIRGLVEKPDDPPSNQAISGVYIVQDTPALFDALEYLIANDIRGAGDEFQLTDALQRMVEQGGTLGTFEVEDWYDCGRPQTLLEANRVLLSNLDTNDGDVDQAVVIPPVDFGTDVDVVGSVVGPNVSVDDGATISNSIVRNAIIGREAGVTDVNLCESIIGDNASIEGKPYSLNVGDNSVIDL
ncbi:glucose-1-phosphate thymidylyltransferase [Halodesulfurarchaeum formicicum]|uniref:Glucose-1-phosphate thymidylyltransferase n=2 Tax=Halodesulfurarchaeum formicicum TaxID=1873524 RepID=A0A1D8S3W0_9EURY|nr:glucose-1-phosphate thymidylyltransferase [Halodesulfurarchaeum formicicum]